jgi:hypothetical protein
MAVCEEAGRDLATELVGFADAPDWRTALRSGLDAYLRWWEERPALARAYLVEVPTAGSRAVAQRERQYRRFEQVLTVLAEWARREEPGLPELRGIMPRTAVIATTELVAAQVREAGPERLHELAGDLRYLLETLLAGRSPG